MPGFKDRMKAIKEHFKRPTRIKPDPKGCLEAAGPGEHIKPPPLTRPSFKDRVKAAVKPFCLKFQCVKRQKDEDDCPGLPEVKVSFVDKDIPESLASRSCISLTDSESDGCPAEADLGSRSDSLEGIPEMLEAESLPSLMDPSAGSCPIEADPGPRADRVPEPQERSSVKQPAGQDFHGNPGNPPMKEDHIHLMCDIFNTSSKEKKRSLADAIASKSMDLMLEHFLKSEETACDKLMYAVFASPKCNLDMCLDEFIVTLNENQIQDSEELPLAKLKALRGIRAILRDHGDIKMLKDWLSCHFVALTNILVSQFEPKKQGTSRKPKMYLVPGEAIDIFAIFLQRLDLMHNMISVFNPR